MMCQIIFLTSTVPSVSSNNQVKKVLFCDAYVMASSKVPRPTKPIACGVGCPPAILIILLYDTGWQFNVNKWEV